MFLKDLTPDIDPLILPVFRNPEREIIPELVGSAQDRNLVSQKPPMAVINQLSGYPETHPDSVQ
jgi:hypothetical protein